MASERGRAGPEEGEAAAKAAAQCLIGAQVGEAVEARGQAGGRLTAAFRQQAFDRLRDLVVAAVE